MILIQKVIIIYNLTNFISYIEFTLTEQGEDVIRSFKGEFGVISVAGMYRTGKSYLINRMLLNRQKGFSVGPTVNPCTKGLWIWSKPIFGDGGKGKRLPLLLIDTEGFGALDTDSNHDIRIFTLAILLSSYFLYNSVGGIDESALQNLNFVINLSKFIRLKSGDTETDPEELSNLFPSFLWVLRDFSLQLIDDNGENITPKEYLEKVLEGTKNIQDPKNKIRKLIKAYFKDRDCYTMVRPLTNENKLQNLEDMPPEQLRPEFLEQIIGLRKKVLGRVKVKTLNGKPLNGEMYLNLVKGLIGALNSGNVPNIENTWLSMCKVESYKAFEEAEQIYENYLKENLENTDDPLEDIHKEAKEQALEHYKNKSLGEVAAEYLKQLKSKIKEKYSYYLKVQDEENKGKIIRVLNKWYSILEQRIQNNEFKSIDEITKDFVTLEDRLSATFPNYGGKTELFNEFKTRVFAFAGNFYAKKAESEKKFLEEQTEQKIKKLKDDLENAKNSYNKENDKKQILLNQNKTQINDLTEELNQTKETLSVLQKEKEIESMNFNNQINRLKDDYERRLKESENKTTDNEEKSKEAQRKLITIKAQYDKDKALLTQRVDLLNKQIDDFTKREKEMKQEMYSQLKEQQIAYKDKGEKYDKTIKSLTAERDQLKESLVDMESNIEGLEMDLQNEKNKNEELTEKTNKEIEELEEELNNLKKASSEEKEKLENELNAKIEELNSELKKSKLKLEENEVKSKTVEDSSRAEIKKMEREIALLKQENSLLKSQNEEKNKANQEQKAYYENIISNLETKAFQVDQVEFQKKIDEVKAYYEEEKKKTEEHYIKDNIQLAQQVDKLTEGLNKCALDLKNTKDELEHLRADSKNTINKLTKENNDMKIEKEKLNSSMSKNAEKLNNKLKTSVADLEKRLEEKENQHQNEIMQMNKTTEENLSQLKVIYENEKNRLELKLKEEKKKSEKKLQNLIEEYETKLKDQENELKDEIENLQNELDDLNQDNIANVNNAEHEIELSKQKIESLEKALKEAKDNLSNENSKNKSNLDSLNELFNNERRELQSKIDTISNDLNNKEKEYAAIISKKEQLEKIINDKDDLINQIKDETIKEKDEFNLKYEELKKKYDALNDGSMMKNLEYTRDNALLNQKIEYLNKKNEETAKIIEDNQKRYEERLFSLRNEVEKDLNEKFERVKKEKADLETKLLNKKKEMKEVEQNFLKQTQTTEKEKNELNDKFNSLQKKYDELSRNYDLEKNSNEKQINLLTKENDSFKNNLNSSEQQMRNKISELEKKLMDKTSQYEKDQILWEGQKKYLEEQRDTLKKENNEAGKRFESMLDAIQKKANAEKESIENNAKMTIANYEQKYLKKEKDLQDAHNKLYTDLLRSNKEMEKELKAIRIENDNIKNKKNNNNELALKIEEMNKEKDKYRKIEDDLKEEQEKKLTEINSRFEKEKDNYKKKIAEIEKNLREAEGKRGALLLELEKEKAKWDIEKDNLFTKNQELTDRIAFLEKKNETLLRDNEKLKSEKNMLRSRGFKNNETRFGTRIGGGLNGRTKFDNSSSTSYKTAMLKALGDYSEDKSETSDKSNKNVSENSDKKEDVKK